MTAESAPVIVTKPGVYDLPEAAYHADPVPEGSLSCSGAKLLVPPSCPAVYQWARKHPRPATRDMEFGTAAHAEVLGAGWPSATWPGTDWTRLVDGVNPQQWRKARRAEGLIPVLASDREKIAAMAAAIRLHPTAALLTRAEEVMPERSFFWRDAQWGFMCRGRTDALRLRGRVIITDYKTAKSADPDEFAKACARYGYHWQDPWYREGVTFTLGDADPLFLYVVQEKDPPYLTAIYELDGESWAMAESRVRAARRVYARCVETGVWDGYQHPDEITTRISVPRWGF